MTTRYYCDADDAPEHEAVYTLFATDEFGSPILPGMIHVCTEHVVGLLRPALDRDEVRAVRLERLP